LAINGKREEEEEKKGIYLKKADLSFLSTVRA
jgi:hypothetical protein